MFNTPYKMNVHSKPEVNSGEILVDVLSYVPAHKRIEEMMLAGQRLKEYRQSQYDFPDGKIDFNASDPTRQPGYDMADAFQQSLEIDAKLAQQKADADAEAEKTRLLQEEAEKASQAEFEAWKASQNNG